MDTSARALAGVELISENLRKHARARFRVLGGSMRPFLRGGDIVEVQREGTRPIRRGEVVAYAREGRIFVHRMIGAHSTNRLLIAKGDAFLAADPPVLRAELLGRVVFVQRGGRRIALDTPWGRAMGKCVAWASAAAPLWYPLARSLKHALRAARS